MTLQERYEWACQDKDIGALIPVLKGYGEQCHHITEFGVRNGVSTTAWLVSRPEKLECYDIGRYESVDEIARQAKLNGVAFEFHEENTAYSNIKDTDLLFIDTVHNREQLDHELWNNHRRVKKFIILHDTETYGEVGEGGATGMWMAILQFLINYKWKIREVRPESNGLTVLERIKCPQ